jgi:hypothetical protein
MRLSSELGVTLAECLERVSVPEFNLWAAYFNRQEEKKWEKGADPLMHYIARLNASVDSIMGARHVKASDYMIDFLGKSDKGFSDPEMQKQALLAAFGISE